MSTTPARRRAVFLDVDGTLLQDGVHLPASAVHAVRQARANGHLVLLSTGRGMAELRGPILDIGFDGAITNGGGFGQVGDDVIVANLMTADEVEHLTRRLAAHGVHWYLQSYERLFASPGLRAELAGRLDLDRRAHVERARAAGVDPESVPFVSVATKAFDDRARWHDDPIAKAVVLGSEPAVGAVVAELSAAWSVVTGTIPLSDGASCEVTRAGVHKGAAIERVLERLGIAAADAIGVGDNWNDVEMFDVCGLSIAMGNAVPEVQALADEVTTAIDDDGIHAAFVKHGLL